MTKWHWLKKQHQFYGDQQPDEYLHMKVRNGEPHVYLGELGMPGSNSFTKSEARLLLGTEYDKFTPIPIED